MALNPAISFISATRFGDPPGVGPGAPPSGKPCVVQITLGATDTYTTGGFNVYPTNTQSNQPQIPYFDLGILAGYGITQAPQTWTPQITVAPTGIATVKFVQGGYDQYGTTSSVLATGMSFAQANTQIATVGNGISLQGLTSATPINVNITDNTGGGGTGVWPLSAGVSKINWISAGTFAVYFNTGGPAGGGNFIWDVPSTGQGAAAEIPAGTSVAGAVLFLLFFGY